MAEKALVPVEQIEVEFYGDQLIAVTLEDGSVYVPANHLCDLLGIAWSSQRLRINRDAVLSEEARSMIVTIMEESGRTRQLPMTCIPLDYVSGFLFGITASRVKPELQERVIRYQRECHKVLGEAFREGRLTAQTPLDALALRDTDAASAFRLAKSVYELAQSHLLLEARIESRFETYDNRLEALEAQLGDPDRMITPSQASALKDGVKAIALHLSARSQRNEFGGVWGEFQRQFEVNSYLKLPASRFDEAMSFLNDWLQSLTSGTPF
jgi:hypothetical protein